MSLDPFLALHQQQGLSGGLGLAGRAAMGAGALCYDRAPKIKSKPKTIREELQAEIDEWVEGVYE
jgi:hypothetical protein